jgi:hypothetical protein
MTALHEQDFARRTALASGGFEGCCASHALGGIETAGLAVGGIIEVGAVVGRRREGEPTTVLTKGRKRPTTVLPKGRKRPTPALPKGGGFCFIVQRRYQLPTPFG